MALGAPQTSKYKIGTAEVRIGALSNANKLTQAFSVGLLDSVTVEATQTSVDLKGGFPKFLADTAIVEQAVTVTATLREYSRRNLKLMLGEGVEDVEPADFQSMMADDNILGATTLDVTAADGASFTAGDLIIIYKKDVAEEVTVARVDSIATDTLTLDTNTPLLHAYNGTTDTVYVVIAHAVPLGAIVKTSYFCMDVIESERATGRPLQWKFWKCALAAGMTVASNADDFASMDFQAKALAPAAADYGTGGDLEHMAAIIPANPMGLYLPGGDS